VDGLAVKVLITGNMGYVGPVVSAHLRKRFPEAEIVGYDLGFFSSCLTGAAVLPEYMLDRQVFGDVRDFDASILQGFDYVVHLAAISNDPISNQFEQATYEINHQATVDIAEKARASGLKGFVFASSCSMYGFAASEARTESHELNPLTPYAKSKVMAERDLRGISHDDFRITALRFCTACGFSPRTRLDLVLNDFAACAVSGQDITVLSDGTPWRPLIDVADMGRAVEWALLREDDEGEKGFLAINVGADESNTQVKDFAHAVAAEIPGTRVSIDSDAPPDKRSYRVDFGLYRRLAPEHQPQVELRSSILSLRDGLGAMGFADGDFRSNTLMRINHLAQLRDRGLLDADFRWIPAP
jgi:nucleoside-diphosphate-sugar epimerase